MIIFQLISEAFRISMGTNISGPVLIGLVFTFYAYFD